MKFTEEEEPCLDGKSLIMFIVTDLVTAKLECVKSDVCQFDAFAEGAVGQLGQISLWDGRADILTGIFDKYNLSHETL